MHGEIRNRACTNRGTSIWAYLPLKRNLEGRFEPLLNALGNLWFESNCCFGRPGGTYREVWKTSKAFEDEHCMQSLRQTFLSGELGNDEHEHQEPQVSILEPTSRKNESKHLEIQNYGFRATAREAPKVSLSFGSLKMNILKPGLGKCRTTFRTHDSKWMGKLEWGAQNEFQELQIWLMRKDCFLNIFECMFREVQKWQKNIKASKTSEK